MAKPIAGGYYPPVGFYFRVEFRNVTGDEIGNNNDIRFQSVSGLNVEFDTESFKEGGENRFEHKLPVRTKYPDLSLKRGMLTDSRLIEWCMDAFQNRNFTTAIITVSLLNESKEPLKTWVVHNAWPKKWNIGDFNAQENALVIETMDFSYNYFTLI